jgi:mxaJ protein
MSSVSRLSLLLLAGCSVASASEPEKLRVCADPNNLPFSNRDGEGFENKLAERLAKDLGKTVEYTWFPQRRGFVRNTLKAEKCDLVIGVPAGYDMVKTTKPYYRSTYVFVTREDRKLDIASYDDPRLADLSIGIHAIGDDYANLPPARALASRGLLDHLHGYSIYGDYSQANPPAELVDAVASGDVDVAIVWGPTGGYFAKHASVPLRVTPVNADEPDQAFSIAFGVRKQDDKLRATVDRWIATHGSAIASVLKKYGVPVVARRESR